MTAGLASEEEAAESRTLPRARVDRTIGFLWLRGHPKVQEARRLVSYIKPIDILVILMALWVGIAVTHMNTLHHRYGTFDFDLAIEDQGIWLLSRGKTFMTVRGLSFFGHHAAPAFLLFVPFYWLGAGPEFLNFTMIVALAAGSLAVFLIAKHYLDNEWHALILGLAFLVNYAAQWMVHESFHPEVMAIVLLLFAYLKAIKGRWLSYALLLGLALMWKEDVALAGLMMGAILAIRGTRTVTGVLGPARTRRVGLWTMAACLLWFVIAMKVIIPSFSPEGAFTESFFGDLGSSPVEWVKTAITNPGLYQQHLANSNPQRYGFDLTSSFGFAAWASPLLLLIALPQATVNLLGYPDWLWTTRVHYAAIPLLAVALASVEGVARFRSLPWRRLMLGMVAVGAFYTAVNWGTSPVGPDYEKGMWQLQPILEQDDFDFAMDQPASSDAVSAAYNLVPHLAHREEIYTFPNPWLAHNWGVKGENRPNPDMTDWLILRPEVLGDPDRRTAQAVLKDPTHLLDSPPTTPDPVPKDGLSQYANPKYWEVIRETPKVFIARRVRS